MKSHKVHVHTQSFSVTRVNRSDYYSDITNDQTLIHRDLNHTDTLLVEMAS